MKQVTTEKVVGQPYRYTSKARQHQWSADAAAPKGGDTAPNPVEQLLGSLGACLAMTIEGAALARSWPVPVIRVTVLLDEIDDPDASGQKMARFRENIELEGDLDATQMERLKKAAQACTVYKLITGKKVFEPTFVLIKPPAPALVGNSQTSVTSTTAADGATGGGSACSA